MDIRLSVFDLDHTLACANVSFAFGRFLYKKRLLSFWRMLVLVGCYALHKSHLLSVTFLHTAAFRLLFCKQRESDIRLFVKEFLDIEQRTLFRPWMLEVLSAAKKRGEHVWIQSSSPEFLVAPIAHYLTIAHYAGSCYEVDERGQFCAVRQIVDGVYKQQLVEQFLQQKGWCWQQVAAYSDGLLDLPLLKKAAYAVAVCPDAKLEKIARANNWPVWRSQADIMI